MPHFSLSIISGFSKHSITVLLIASLAHHIAGNINSVYQPWSGCSATCGSGVYRTRSYQPCPLTICVEKEACMAPTCGTTKIFKENSDISMPCTQFEIGDGQASWFKYNTAMNTWDMVTFQRGKLYPDRMGNLIIKKISIHDQGSFKCTLTINGAIASDTVWHFQISGKLDLKLIGGGGVAALIIIPLFIGLGYRHYKKKKGSAYQTKEREHRGHMDEKDDYGYDDDDDYYDDDYY